ncbi:hypothetical protein FRC17_001671 [Serendipita sp. 399]|nr:hypothetical protein FRC17_001671 [Serendipita sp. 399]
MIELTVNAPNWEVLLAARTARDLLFESWRNVPLDSFKDVYQTLVDVFSTPWDSDSEFVALKRSLITYYSLLKTTHLTNGELANLPLSQSRKASSESPVPSRLSTILPLLRESIAVLIRLPLFLVPLMINLPIYWTTRWAGEKASVDEESIAQSKVVVGLVLFIAIHGFWFWIIWMCLAVTPIGALIAGTSVWGLATYHQKLIDDNYLRAKRLLSAYRVLVGVWGPQRWDLSLSALTQYTTTQPPPENPFLKLPESVKNALVRSSSSPTAPTLSSIDAAAPTPTPTGAPKVKRSQRPPSRKLIRHLFRARADAIRRLAAFIRKLDDPSVRVCASGFMARSFNPDPNGVRESLFDKVPGGTNAIETVQGGVETELNPTGWRSGKEVITYLRLKGAKVGKVLREGEGGEQAVQWDAVAAMGSEAELSSPGSGDEQVRIKQEEVEKCATEISDEEVARVEKESATRKQLLMKAPDEDPTARSNVSVAWHVIYKNETFEGGLLQDWMVNASIGAMNDHYAQTGIHFQLDHVDYTLNETWFIGADPVYKAVQNDMKQALRVGDSATLNIYTVGFGTRTNNDLLGYSTFPWWLVNIGNTTANTINGTIDDGVVIVYSSIPDGTEPHYNEGKTLTHEVGHWLGLYHPFQGGCTGYGDGVMDTPPQVKAAYGCPIGQDSCYGDGVDNIHNFMDYSYDACLFEFTAGQAQRAREQTFLFRNLTI